MAFINDVERHKEFVASQQIHNALGPNPFAAPTLDTTQAILAERGNRYGRFDSHARISQNLKNAIASWIDAAGKHLDPDQQEALDMICHKIARIINGDPNYADNWADIAGYARLVADRLEGVGQYERT